MPCGFKYVWGPIFNHDAIRNRIKTQFLAQGGAKERVEDISELIVMGYIEETICKLADEEDRPFSTVMGYPLEGPRGVGQLVFVHAAGNDKEALENAVNKLQLRAGLQREKDQYGVVDDPQIWEVLDDRGGYFWKGTYEDVDDWGPRGSRLVHPNQQTSNLD